MNRKDKMGWKNSIELAWFGKNLHERLEKIYLSYRKYFWVGQWLKARSNGLCKLLTFICGHRFNHMIYTNIGCESQKEMGQSVAW